MCCLVQRQLHGIDGIRDVCARIVGEILVKALRHSAGHVEVLHGPSALTLLFSHLLLHLVLSGHLLDGLVVWQSNTATGRAGTKLLYLAMEFSSGRVWIVLPPALELFANSSALAADFLAAALHSNADATDAINHRLMYSPVCAFLGVPRYS